MRPSSLILPLSLALGLLAAGVFAPSARAADELEAAEAALDRLEGVMKKRKTINETLIAGLDEVMEYYNQLQPPVKPEPLPIPDEATDEEKKEIEKQNDDALDDWEDAVKKWDREVGKFKKDVRDALIDAFKLVKPSRQTHINEREDVNIKAVELIATMSGENEEIREDMSDDLIKAMEGVLFKAKDYDPTELLYEKAFAALGALNDMDALEWIIEEFTHTRSSPQKEVMKLSAAHKAMVLFKNVPGKTRYELVDEMIKNYAGVESQAEQSSADPKVQEKKRFWDRIKMDVIAAVQYYAAEPRDAEGQVIARMDGFQDWFRDNDNARRAPWTDPDE